MFSTLFRGVFCLFGFLFLAVTEMRVIGAKSATTKGRNALERKGRERENTIKIYILVFFFFFFLFYLSLWLSLA